MITKKDFFRNEKGGGNAARPQKFSATHLLADYTTNVHGTDRPLRYFYHYFFLLLLLDVCEEEEEEEELEEVTSFFFFFFISFCCCLN